MSYYEYMHGVKLEELTVPKTGEFSVFVNHWWFVDQSGNLIFYKRSSESIYSHPMCNIDKGIAELVKRPYPLYDLKQIPLVFVPHNCEEH